MARNVAAELMGIPADVGYEARELADAIGNDIVMIKRLPPLFYDRDQGRPGAHSIGPGLIRTRDDLPKMVFEEDDAWIAEARDFLRTQRGHRAAVAGTRLGISPTLLSMGLDGFSIALYEDRGLVEEVIDRYVAFSRRTVEVFGELGFDALWVFDDFAYKTGPMFSPEVFREVFVPRLQVTTEAIGIPWIFHSDGNLLPVLDDLLTLGMSGLHPVEPEAMDLAEAKKAVNGRACLIGNVSVGLLASGTPEEVEATVERTLDAGAPGGGYMFSSGNSIPSYAKVENVRAMISAFAAGRGRYGAAPS